MYKFAFVNAIGEPQGAIESTLPNEGYVDGGDVNGLTARSYADLDVSSGDIIARYYYKDGWHERGEKPAEHYLWNSTIEQWQIDLDILRNKKSFELSMACRTAVTSGYLSSALGGIHHYPSTETDQMNMIASVTDSYNPTNQEEWITPFWCRDANDVWGYRLHSKEQIQKAGSDGKAHIIAQLSKNAYLQSLLPGVNTQEQLDAIVWS